jgi:hypothetical protein
MSSADEKGGAPGSEFATVREVATFLAVQPEDVRRMIHLDNLPAWRMPSAKRIVFRVILGEFYEWQRERATADRFPARDRWLAGFERSRAKRELAGAGKGGAE